MRRGPVRGRDRQRPRQRLADRFLGPVNDTSPVDLANDLALETAAPAIAQSVFDSDSDCVFATAADPCGGAVKFYLNEEIVQALVDDNDRFEPLSSQAAAVGRRSSGMDARLPT